MSRKKFPIWFYRDPKGWWQLRVLFLFFFSSGWCFGFRLFDLGLSIYVKGLHSPSFSTRQANRPIKVEFLPPCNAGHFYWRIARRINPDYHGVYHP